MRIIHAPLYDYLQRRAASQPVSFHVPGHHFGYTLPDDPYAVFKAIMRLDVTELADTDDLHHPEGIIQEAQQLAARCFGAEHSFFLTGGSTAGNMAMIMAACEPGDLLIVQRNVHKSVMNGLALAGVRAVFVAPETDPPSGLATVPAMDDLSAAIERYPEAKGVLLSTPNYYGMAVDMKPYAELLHRGNRLLLVDEAHGAHYGLHPSCPASAIHAGADAVVQSTHKTLTALTMGAMLHMREGLLTARQVQHALAIVQSSSPSYPILASLDIARAMVDAYGVLWFDPAIRIADDCRRRIQAMNGSIKVLLKDDTSESFTAQDPLRLTLYDDSGSWSGFELLHRLTEYGCWAEMADERHVVLLFGVSTSAAEADKLIHALELMQRQISEKQAEESQVNTPPERVIQSCMDVMPERIGEPFLLSRLPAHPRDSVRIPVDSAIGRRCAETILPYPPGIPLLYPGELIQQEVVTALKRLAEQHARFQGAEDPAMQTVRVYQ